MKLSNDALIALRLIKKHGGGFTVLWRYQSPDSIKYFDGTPMPTHWFWSVINKELIKTEYKHDWIKIAPDDITITREWTNGFDNYIEKTSLLGEVIWKETYPPDFKGKEIFIFSEGNFFIKDKSQPLISIDVKHNIESYEYTQTGSDYFNIRRISTSDYGVIVRYTLKEDYDLVE